MMVVLVINETVLAFGRNFRNTKLKKEQCEDPKRFSQKAEIFLDSGCCSMRFDKFVFRLGD